MAKNRFGSEKKTAKTQLRKKGTTRAGKRRGKIVRQPLRPF